MEKNFKKELEGLINSYSKENGSDTPDFILAEYLNKCLKVFNATVSRREAWYGRKTMPIQANVKELPPGVSVHELKTWMPHFQYILNETKSFEYCINDRDFKLDDILHLRECNQKGYTGRNVYVKVIYILLGGGFGIPEGYCIMSVKKLAE